MTRELILSMAFVRAAKRIARKQTIAGEAIRHALEQLRDDAFEPRLRTHKLKGELVGRWASSAGYDLRIVFKFVQRGGAEAILLLSVGTQLICTEFKGQERVTQLLRESPL